MSALLLFIIGRNCAIVKWCRNRDLNPEFLNANQRYSHYTIPTEKYRMRFVLHSKCNCFMFAECILKIYPQREFHLLRKLVASLSASYTILEDLRVEWDYYMTHIFPLRVVLAIRRSTRLENFAYQVRFHSYITKRPN